MEDHYLEGSDRPTSSRGKQEKKERKGRTVQDLDDSCTTDDQEPTDQLCQTTSMTSCATYTFAQLATTTPWYSSTKWAYMLLQKYGSNAGILLTMQCNDNSTCDDFYV